MLTTNEKLVLKELRRDSRQSFARISENTGIPAATVLKTYDFLTEHIIEKHTSLIDFREAKHPLRTAIITRDRESVSPKNLNSMHLTSEGDYWAELVFRTMKERQEALEKTKPIIKYDLIEDLKKESFHPI